MPEPRRLLGKREAIGPAELFWSDPAQVSATDEPERRGVPERSSSTYRTRGGVRGGSMIVTADEGFTDVVMAWIGWAQADPFELDRWADDGGPL